MFRSHLSRRDLLVEINVSSLPVRPSTNRCKFYQNMHLNIKSTECLIVGGNIRIKYASVNFALYHFIVQAFRDKNPYRGEQS